MNKIESIAVFCGSSEGNNPEFAKKAYELGKIMAEHDITLVYGGGSRGIMGRVAKGCSENGGYVVGVIPQFLKDIPSVEAGKYESELIVTDDMHRRKSIMCDRADAFIALPGGIGTFEEIMEQMAWLQLRLHNKPCGFLNVNGFYGSLIDFLKHAVDTEFTKKSVFNSLCFEDEPEKLIQKLKNVKIDIPPKNK